MGRLPRRRRRPRGGLGRGDGRGPGGLRAGRGRHPGPHRRPAARRPAADGLGAQRGRPRARPLGHRRHGLPPPPSWPSAGSTSAFPVPTERTPISDCARSTAAGTSSSGAGGPPTRCALRPGTSAWPSRQATPTTPSWAGCTGGTGAGAPAPPVAAAATSPSPPPPVPPSPVWSCTGAGSPSPGPRRGPWAPVSWPGGASHRAPARRRRSPPWWPPAWPCRLWPRDTGWAGWPAP